LVEKLNFSKIKLSLDLNTCADLILKDKKHLDNNPKNISKQIIIDLLKKIDKM
jgi:succinate semialdehyde reductase